MPSIWISFAEAWHRYGKERLQAALPQDEVEARGRQGLRGPLLSIPAADWRACTFEPTLDGKPVQGVYVAFWHERWTDIELRRADVEALAKPSGIRTNSAARDDEACGAWLAALGAAETRTKDELKAEAQRLFPKLSGRAFTDRIWPVHAPDHLKKPGPRRKR